MPEPVELTAGKDDAGTRLDVFVARVFAGISRSRVQKAIAAGQVLVNGVRAISRTSLREGDTVTGCIPGLAVWSVAPEDIPVSVVYEDACLAVINKPRGLAVHPGSGRPSGTLVNALAARFGALPEASYSERPGIVHRLDKDTSGLMLVALDAATMTRLGEMIASREVERRYLALVWGNPAFQTALVDAFIGRDSRHPDRMAVVPEGSPRLKRAAVTELTVRERFADAALLEATLRTGRTHQIRVHCAYAGHPLVGDKVYGGSLARGRLASGDRDALRGLLERLNGQALHAWALRFTHPATGLKMSFEEPAPPEMMDVLDFLRRRQGTSG